MNRSSFATGISRQSRETVGGATYLDVFIVVAFELISQESRTPMNPPSLSTTRRLKRIAPLQLGKMLALLYGILGLIFIPFFLIMSAAASQMPAEQRAGMLAFGAGFAILVPFIYAAMGFIGGIIGAVLYNLVAKWIGGIEVEVE